MSRFAYCSARRFSSPLCWHMCACNDNCGGLKGRTHHTTCHPPCAPCSIDSNKYVQCILLAFTLQPLGERYSLAKVREFKFQVENMRPECVLEWRSKLKKFLQLLIYGGGNNLKKKCVEFIRICYQKLNYIIFKHVVINPLLPENKKVHFFL